MIATRSTPPTDLTMRGLRIVGRLCLAIAVIVAGLIAVVGNSEAVRGPAASESRTTLLDGPRDLFLHSRGLLIRAALGSNCLFDRPKARNRNILCEDRALALRPTRAALPVAPGSLRVLTGAPARSISVGLERVSRSGRSLQRLGSPLRTRREDRSGTRWRIKLPARAREASVISASVRFRDKTSAEFSARVRPIR